MHRGLKPGLRLAVLAQGAFGDSVGNILMESPPHAVAEAHRHPIGETALDLDADVAVIALSSPRNHLCEAVQEWALAAPGRRWVPVVMDSIEIRVGPFVAPGRPGACFTCATSRQIQHDDQHSTTRVLLDLYRADPDRDVRGFLPHHARLAAAFASRLVDSPAANASVVTIDMIGAEAFAERVVPCHGCRTCGSSGRQAPGAIAAAISQAHEPGRSRVA